MGSPSHETDPGALSLETVLSNFSGMVRRVGWRYRLSDADLDELMQDVRIRLWRAQTGGADGTREKITAVPASYIYRTATTAALDIIRRRRADRTTSHDDVVDVDSLECVVDYSVVTVASPDQTLEVSELSEQVARAIDTIPESRRAVVRMYLAGYPREEIATVMGWTEAKTRNLLYRGLSDLRTRLAALGIGADGEEQ